MRSAADPFRGDDSRSLPARLLGRLRAFLQPAPTERLPALTRSMLAMPVAQSYLAAHAESRYRRAGAAAASASSQALAAGDWGAADVWARHALWQFERAGMVLHAARAARRVGDARVAGGRPAAARRWYAEAIGEARDIGAQREQGLAALGLARAELELGNVTSARRLAHAAIELLERSAAPEHEVAAARQLRGHERVVGASTAS